MSYGGRHHTPPPPRSAAGADPAGEPVDEAAVIAAVAQLLSERLGVEVRHTEVLAIVPPGAESAHVALTLSLSEY